MDPIATIREDTTHGSAWLSARALEGLAEQAAAADEYEAVAALARDLCTARPSMHAVANRVNRAMTEADARTPEAVAASARAGRERAARADERAAATAAAHIGGLVCTLSQSGTVRAALDDAVPERVLVLESRPGGEGAATAEALAADHAVTVATDANVAGALADADALLVGADAVLPDGSVVNKVGTRAAATVAGREGVAVVVACASAKVAPTGTDGFDPEPRDPAELYDGDAPVTVVNPTFDRTPADLVDVVATERGPLDAEDVRMVADEHAAAARWTD